MQPLTRKQQQVLDAIAGNIAEGSPMPTLRELCSRFRWASTASARDYLKALVRKGYLVPAEGRSRGYSLARSVEIPKFVPLLGEVPAGNPVDAVEHVECQLPVPPGIVSPSPSFALRVKGASMNGAGIEPGDIIFVRKQETAELGQIVVARVGFDSEVTVKRLGRLKKHLALMPENPAFQPIRVGPGTVIVGVVVGLLRGYEGRKVRARSGE